MRIMYVQVKQLKHVHLAKAATMKTNITTKQQQRETNIKSKQNMREMKIKIMVINVERVLSKRISVVSSNSHRK